MSESLADPGQRQSPRRLLGKYLHDARRVQQPGGRKAAAPSADRPARDRIRDLVEPHLFFVVQLASEYNGRDVCFEDLVAEGNIGLVEAAHRFDAKHNVKFLTYASWWIRKRMLEFVVREGRSVRLTRYARERRRDVQRAQEVLRERLGRQPSPEEVSEHLGLDLRKVIEHLGAAPVMVSLEQDVGRDGGNLVRDVLPDTTLRNPEDRLVLDRLRELVQEEVARLPEREQMIIRNRFSLDGNQPMTFQEIGHLLGLSRERARQIERRALARLRQRLDRRLHASVPPPASPARAPLFLQNSR